MTDPWIVRLRKVFSPGLPPAYADPSTLAKGVSFPDRFREVISDPVNLLIARVPEAGYVDTEGRVVLHNGNRVPLRGPHAYYGEFSDLLVLNRGVHEPLEEYCFQQVLGRLPAAPVMLELGAYWGHYSMWLKRARPDAACHLVEPDPANLACGRHNFRTNGLVGEFHPGRVGRGAFSVDGFSAGLATDRLHVLHADIQGAEAEMLDGAAGCLSARRADCVFVSTHTQTLHAEVAERLAGHGYRVEISSDFADHTTSGDGFVLATSPLIPPVFAGWRPLGRKGILQADPATLRNSLPP